jgi:hypothetical protein
MTNFQHLRERVKKWDTRRAAVPQEPEWLPPLVVSVRESESSKYLCSVLWFDGRFESWSANSGAEEPSSEMLDCLRNYGYSICREEVSGVVKWRLKN